MANPKTIRDQIITILTTANPLNEAGVSIKKWFKGQPPLSRAPAFPWGWVEWSGGVMQPPVGSKAEINDNFFIVIVDINIMFVRFVNIVIVNILIIITTSIKRLK